MIFSKIHSFSKPVPLPPVRKWQTDLPETRKCAVSQTKKITNSLFGLCMHWIGSGSKQHKKRRGKLVLIASSNAAGGPRWLPRAERFCYRRINTTTSLALYYSFICLAPSGLSATRSSPSPLSSTSVVDALFIPRWETLKRWSIQHFPPPPRAPRRARFPRPPLEKRDGQFNISPPDRDRFIFVSSFAAYLATYPSAADRDRFTFVSSFAAYLATYPSAALPP